MIDPFRNQAAAREFIAAISDERQKLLTEAALSRAIGEWTSDPKQRATLASEPVDLLVFVRGVHALFRMPAALEGILDGNLKTIDDVSDVF